MKLFQVFGLSAAKECQQRDCVYRVCCVSSERWQEAMPNQDLVLFSDGFANTKSRGAKILFYRKQLQAIVTDLFEEGFRHLSEMKMRRISSEK